MISQNENLKQVFSHRKINNTILNILLRLYYNVFKTLKWKYMLNLIFSDKTAISKVFYNKLCSMKNSSMKHFSLREIYNNKSEKTMISQVQ